MIFAAILFALSLASIVALFVLKYWEEKHGRVLRPLFRATLDARAGQAKELLAALEADLQKLPPEAVNITRVGLHQLALSAARFARFLEDRSHRLADLVSHKGHFVRRAPRSEFLTKVMEHKNGNGTGNDSPSVETIE